MESYAVTPTPARLLPGHFALIAILFGLSLVPVRVFAQAGNEHQFDARFQQIEHFVVIYQENWSFDSLYGLFPGANGLFQSSATSLTQRTV
jgi:phospholipase C